MDSFFESFPFQHHCFEESNLAVSGFGREFDGGVEFVSLHCLIKWSTSVLLLSQREKMSSIYLSSIDQSIKTLFNTAFISLRRALPWSRV